MTKTQPERAESPPGKDKCECTKKPKRKRKPREVCHKGTYIESTKGLTKHAEEQVPCQ